MPIGGKEDRMMHHIKDSEIERGVPPKVAEGIAWAHIKHPKSSFKQKTDKVVEDFRKHRSE